MKKLLLQSIAFSTLLIFISHSTAQQNIGSVISPIPALTSYDAEKVKLGKKLYYEKRLSINDTVSCASCHHLDDTFYGTDLSPVSTGIEDKKGGRNAPTVFNSSLNFAQFWDGRSKDLKEQAGGPIINPVEMGMKSVEDAVAKIKSDPNYIQAFEKAYNKPVNANDLVDAIAKFEETLLTRNSPFDRFLNGEENAITDEQKRGFKLFKAYGCVSCHQGRNVGGNMYQKMGALKDINMFSGNLSSDLGRYNHTKNEWDKRVFKVPSLRLAAVTPPYFHNGSVATLREAILVMVEFQLGRKVPEQDIQAIIAFLKSLVGEIPEGVKES